MAFEQLFIRVNKSIEGIQLDAVVSESHEDEVTTTDNPVELGANVTDHSVKEPNFVDVVAVVTNTPLGTSSIGQIVDNVTGLFGSSTEGNEKRSAEAYRLLKELQNRRELVTLQTKLEKYTDMLLVKISVTQTSKTSNIVRLNMRFKKLFIADTETTLLQKENLKEGVTTDQASPVVKRGRQEPVVPEESKSSSVLKTVFDWISG